MNKFYSTLTLCLLFFFASCENKVVRNELETLAGGIDINLPSLCKSSPIGSRCWLQHSVDERSYSVPKDKAESLKSFYINRGYSVHLDNDSLVFDFKPQYGKYLLHKEIFISLESTIFLSLFALCTGIFWYGSYKRREQVKVVQKAWENSKKDLIFSNNEDLKLFESELSKKRIPNFWSAKLSDDGNRIVGILESNGNYVRSIVWSKTKLIDSFGSLGLYNKKKDSK